MYYSDIIFLFLFLSEETSIFENHSVFPTSLGNGHSICVHFMLRVNEFYLTIFLAFCFLVCSESDYCIVKITDSLVQKIHREDNWSVVIYVSFFYLLGIAFIRKVPTPTKWMVPPKVQIVRKTAVNCRNL